MIFRAYQPGFPLDHFVKKLIYTEGFSAPHNLDRFLPDGNSEIIIDLTELPQHIYDNKSLQAIQTCRSAWVSGVRTRPITIPSGNGSRMLIVVFKKGRVFPFYPFPLSDLTDTVAEADLVFGRSFNNLREQLLCTKPIDRMFPFVERFLLQQAGEALQTNPSDRCIEYAVSSIIHKPTMRGLHELSEEIGYSQKHFIDLFRQRVGVTPKQYLKIMRFQKAIGSIETRENLDWSQIALESGFYDQAHFIRDFKQFSGFTPNEYIQRKTDILNYVPVH